MQLKPDQRSILAAFTDMKHAEKAAAELKENGFEMVQVDELQQEPGEPTDAFHYVISGDVPGLANVVLGTSLSSRDAAVLKAADPAASGMADGSRQPLTGQVLLTVVMDKKDESKAEAIIRKHGGNF